MSHSFVPFAPTIAFGDQSFVQDSLLMRSPILSTKNVAALHFGHSYLFRRNTTD